MTSVMQVTASDYNNTNELQYSEGTEILRELQADDECQKDFDIVIDIGCGSGNITNNIPYLFQGIKLVVGVDIDSDMIQFAKSSRKDANKVDFVIQDIALPWEKLEEKLKSLEGKVAFVFSNLALHWIKLDRRPVAIANISRLLKPGGLFFANVALIQPLNKISDDDQLTLDKFDYSQSESPGLEKEIEMWKTSAETVGFKIKSSKIYNTVYTVEETSATSKMFWDVSTALYLKRLSVPAHEEEGVKNILKKGVGDIYTTTSPNGSVTWNFDNFKFYCVKI